ncbi:HupE/UreJ family protein [Ideonella sp. A 288]|uniref:HupE/UreJ family protein n=1 Tax=Ideonella sp. A 288 TaxID=1962181 RepID=UPI000B4B03A1|nr:HupE/UreJ family protein [Ideonella sp. A 288]
MNAPLVLILLLTVASPVSAHSAGGMAGGFLSGVLHPLAGPDHVAAMVAVGLWGAFLGRPAVWMLPVVFPMVMASGGALAVLGVPMPGVEAGIAGSAIVLGAMVALAAKPPWWVAATIVGAFAVFHGHAHGTELPDSVSPVAYSLGFVSATGLLHAGGIALSQVHRWWHGAALVRACGAAIAALGVFYLANAL